MRECFSAVQCITIGSACPVPIPYTHVGVHILYINTHVACARSSTHSGVHNASTMSPDGVGDVANVDGVEVLIVRRTLNKDLVRK